MKKLYIKDIKNNNKPRERLIEKGAYALSDAELLAIIIATGGTGTSVLDLAGILLKKFKSLGNLTQQPILKLVKEKNIGISKASKICVLAEIYRRIQNEPTQHQQQINSPEKAATWLKGFLKSKKQECLYMMSLDIKKQLIATDLISIGTVSETLFPLRELIVKALERDAVSIIIAHNHPSGDINPSPQDITTTNSVHKACRVVGINLLDHLILSNEKYLSLKSINLISNGEEV